MIAPLILVALYLVPAQTGTPAQSPRSYRISGSVVDAITGTPIPNAQVAVYLSNDPEGTTTAGPDGTFSFEGVEPGKKYRIYASAPGYLTESYNQHEFYLTAVAVGDGLDSEHIIIRLHPGAVIYGVVTNERGQPIRHAQVTLFGRIPGNTKPGPRGGADTNDLGAYRFSHLTSGKYYLAVQAQPWYAQTGFKYVTEPARASRFRSFISYAPRESNPALDVVYPITFYQSATDEREATEIDLAAGDKREADIQLTAVPSVHIRMTNLPADPAQSVGFSASQAVFGSVLGGATGVAYRQIAPGEYEVAGLPPANVTLTVNEAQSRTIHVDLATAETINASATTAPAIISGQVIPPPDFALERRLQGSVMLTNEQNAGVSVAVQKDGSFSFASVEPGTYKVSVFMNQSRGQTYVQRLSATGARTLERQITVDSGANVRLAIAVGDRPGEITGVAIRDGRPFAGAMVLLAPESGANFQEDHRMDESDSDGTFALRDVIPGKYTLIAIDDGWDLNRSNRAVLKPYRDKGQSIQLAPDQNLKITVEVQPLISGGSSSTAPPPTQ